MKKLPVLLLPMGLMVSTTAWAEGIATDGSMGTAQNITGNAVTIPQELGKTVGNNLFHSFSDFNINNGQAVTFTGSDSLQNVISRVTGNNPSIIDGILKSDIKNADFYFINPHGITFNVNAQVDVPAAFYVSTADKMDFGKNGGVFYADLSKDSQLSTEPPSAFGFLGNSTIGNGLVDIDNAHLQLKDGKTFDVVSGTINIEGKGYQDEATEESLEPTVNSNGGEVRLVAFTGPGNVSLQHSDSGVLALPEDNAEHGGKISINGGYVDTSGDGAGRIAAYGGDITITNGGLQTDNIGNIHADESKGISVQAKNIKLIGSTISSSATIAKENNANSAMTEGNAGNITLIATDSVQLNGVINKNVDGDYFSGSYVYSDTYTNGNGGNVIIKAKDLELIGSHISTWSSATIAKENNANSAMTEGNAGNITLIATDSVHLNGVINKNVDGDYFSKSYVYSDTNTNGNGGNVIIKAKDLELTGSYISTGSEQVASNNGEEGSLVSSIVHGNAGNVDVDITDSIRMLTTKELIGGYPYYSSIFSGTKTNGNAGNVTINAKNIELQGSYINAITSIFQNQDSDFNVINSILTQGDGGNVTVNASNTLKLDSYMYKNPDGSTDWYMFSYIGSDTLSNGDGGGTMVNARNLEIRGGGIGVSSSINYNFSDKEGNFGVPFFIKGTTGDVTVNVTDSIKMTGDVVKKADGSEENRGSSISSDTSTNGSAGNVIVNARTIDLQRGGVISSSARNFESYDKDWNITQTTLATGKAGNVTVKADELVLNGENTEISTSTYTKGLAGEVDINVNNVNVLNGASISSGSFGIDSSGQSGNIKINAQDLDIKSSGTITIKNEAVVENNPQSIPVGTIDIHAKNINIDDALITSESTGNVNAGNIRINYDNLFKLTNKAFINATSVDGNGGYLSISSPSGVLSLQDSRMATTATGAISNGGNIDINSDIMILNTGSLLASTVGGKGGNITLNLQSLVPSSNNLIEVGAKQFNWKPYSGLNVLGASGSVKSNVPQLNLSGVLANITNATMDNSLISQDYCALGQGSSLSKKGRGALPFRPRDLQVY